MSCVSIIPIKSHYTPWLVFSTPLKNMKVSWDYYIPNIWEIKNMFETTNQNPIYMPKTRLFGPRLARLVHLHLLFSRNPWLKSGLRPGASFVRPRTWKSNISLCKRLRYKGFGWFGIGSPPINHLRHGICSMNNRRTQCSSDLDPYANLGRHVVPTNDAVSRTIWRVSLVPSHFPSFTQIFEAKGRNPYFFLNQYMAIYNMQ